MKKLRNSIGLALLSVAATALAGCGTKEEAGTVHFWSSFGAAYSGAVERICAKASSATGVPIAHQSSGSYPQVRKDMILAIADASYPELAIGYPDHFVSYLENNTLLPLDERLSAEEKADYFEDYLTENRFYDNGGANAKERLYGIPFNKSTELLGYNGVFVDYCAQLEGYESYHLEQVPATWQEWAVKGPKYREIFDKLITDKAQIRGVQNNEGHVTSFGSGEILLDFKNVDKAQTQLMAWDATDNAFITLIKQWGARYTELPVSQAKNPVYDRVGKAYFASSTDLPKVVQCLRFLNGLHKDKIFGVPKNLGAKYASDAFEQCRVMFMICSSGGLSYNTTNWKHRFRVAPIPYYDDGEVARKYVIAQGANICLTNKGETDNALKVMKALTTGDIQADFCLETGYFPGSKSAYNSQKYQNFLKDTTNYSSGATVAFREGAQVNANIYHGEGSTWNCFVDAAFIGSAILREKLEGVIASAIDIDESKYGSETEIQNAYKKIFTDIKKVADIAECGTLEFVS